MDWEILNEILNKIPFAILISDKNDIFNFFYVSGAIKPLLGLDPSELKKDGHLILGCIHEDYREKSQNFFMNAASNNFFSKENSITYKLKNNKWINHQILNLDNGKRDYIVSLLFDVSEKKELFSKIIGCESRFDRFLEKNPLAIVFLHKDGRMIRANDQFWALTGLEPDSSQDHFNNSLSFLNKMAKKVMAGEEIFRQRISFRNAKGKRIIAFSTAFPFLNGNSQGERSGGCILLEDITKWISLEEELIRQRDFNKATVETAGILVAEIDLTGKIFRANTILASILGKSQMELVGADFLEFFHEDTRQKIENALRAAVFSKESTTVEGHLLDKTGQKRCILLTINPGFDKARGDMHLLMVGRDLTVQREMEKRLRQVQKMEAIGRLAGGVAHEFNNQLTAIIGYCQMLMMRLDAQDEIYKKIEVINRAAKRASETTNKLLAFSRQQSLKTQSFSFNEIVKEACEFFKPFIGENIKVEFIPGDKDCFIQIDKSRFLQVFLNLALNAKDAIGVGGSITITTRVLSMGHDKSPLAIIEFRDSGCGMNKEVLARAFEPFFTTKPPGQGTGLGLAMVYGTIKQSGGDISIDSKPGLGTTVTISLPGINISDESLRHGQLDATADNKDRLVFLVEDEPVVQETVTAYFKSLKFNIETFSNGEEVFSFIESNPDKRPYLVLTDIVMPGMNGYELAQRIREIMPECKIIYMSGYGPESLPQVHDNDTDTVFLQKPFTLKDLLVALERL